MTRPPQPLSLLISNSSYKKVRISKVFDCCPSPLPPKGFNRPSRHSSYIVPQVPMVSLMTITKAFPPFLPHLGPVFNQAVLRGFTLPKLGKPPTVRPISLLNTDFKIYVKILATLLKKCMPLLIGPNQVDFVLSRQALDGTR